MLNIRQEQNDAFLQHRARSFECRMYAHVTRIWPAECKELGEEAVRQTIRFGVGRAQVYGLALEYDVARYVDLTFVYGRDFDKDPRLPWVRAILNDDRLDPSEKMDSVCQKAADLARTSGSLPPAQAGPS
jgi:hypothetical protein